MRLIDADALKDNFFDNAPFEMMWDRGDIRHKIDEMPTIDAIPVSWLRAMRLEHPEIDMERLYDAVTRMVLALWENEQEGR